MCMQAPKVLSQAAAALTPQNAAGGAPGVQPRPLLLQLALQGFLRLRGARVQPWSQQALQQMACSPMLLKEDRGEVLQSAKQAAWSMPEQMTTAQQKLLIGVLIELLRCRVKRPNPGGAAPELPPHRSSR